MNAVSDPVRVVHVVAPDAIDDPRRPSGGNRYDRQVCTGLTAAGWQVHEHLIPDAWPRLGRAGFAALAQVLPQLPDGATVLVDGLVAEGSAALLVPAASRVALTLLVHGVPEQPRALDDVLAAARTVIATSGWTRCHLRQTYGVRDDAVVVAVPGVEQRGLAAGTADGGKLLCIGAVALHKGHDVLLDALATLGGSAWSCRWVGSLDHDQVFARRLCHRIDELGLADRIEVTGPMSGVALDRAFLAADVLVHPARTEAYGMVVIEALAYGLPVVTTTAGGLPDALGADDGEPPGLLVPPDDVPALARAIGGWLADADLRERLRVAAHDRRRRLPTWSATVQQIATALDRQ